MAGIDKPIWPGRPDPEPEAAGETKGWIERWKDDFTGNDTDFEAGGDGTTAEFSGVTFTAHIGGAGANDFDSGSTGLRINADYQTRLVASASSPEWPGLWALAKDLLGGSWDGLTPICIQARIEFPVAPAADFETAGIVLWQPADNWFVWLHAGHNGALGLWFGRKTPTNIEYKPAGTLPGVLELHLSGGVLVDVYSGAWSGEWPPPGTLTRLTDASFAVKGDLTPGSSTNRVVDPDTLRVTLCAANNNGARNFESTFKGLRVLELVTDPA